MTTKNIYIVYAHEDQVSFEQLKADLESNFIPFREFVDAHHLPWGLVVDDIKKYDLLLFIASPAAKASEPVAHVYEIAQEYHVPIIPFWVNGTAWNDVALPGLESTPYIDARVEYSSAYARLLLLLTPTVSPDLSRFVQALTIPFIVAGGVIGGLIGQWSGGTQDSIVNGVLLGIVGGFLCDFILTTIIQALQNSKESPWYFSLAFSMIPLLLGAWLGAKFGGWGGVIFGGITGYILGFALGVIFFGKNVNQQGRGILYLLFISSIPLFFGAWLGALIGGWGGGVLGGIIGFIIGTRIASPFYRKRITQQS